MEALETGTTNSVQHLECRFPTASAGEIQSGSVKINDTFDDYILKSYSEDCLASSSLLESAWAVLIKFYVQSDLIYFLHTERPEGMTGERGRPFAYDCHVWKYQISGHPALDMITAYEKVPIANTFANFTNINTAIDREKPSSTQANNHASCESRCAPRNSARSSQIDLVLVVQKRRPRLVLRYRKTVISPSYAASIAANFDLIIDLSIKKPELLLKNASLLADVSRDVIQSWIPKNPWRVEVNRCMHNLVHEKAQQIPDNEAVCAWDGSFTYSTLDTESDIVAAKLLSLGVSPGEFVLFGFEKTKWTVVATLGILKAGAAFVPFNPHDPRARVRDVIDRVDARVVLTMSCFIDTLKDLVETVLVVPCVLHNGTQLNIPNLTISPSDPIFVLFTSGSTGKPKGMVHTHSSICTHASVHGESMGYHGARVLQFSAHTFDIAIIDIYTTLLFGGCVCIPSEEDRRNNITGVINAMRVDYAILTPSIAGLIEPSDVPTLKTLAVGGEAVPQDRVDRWADKVHLIQVYGPAEAGICLTQVMTRDILGENVGYALPNSSCWLVDPNDPDQLVPIGAAGELVIAGPSITLGYIKEEAKNQSSFLCDPAWAKELCPGVSRFYKTGDLLRYNVAAFDGSFNFVGRKDAQIKLFGQRIEPGEIEYHIGRISHVAMSMVARPQGGCLGGKLVAVIQERKSKEEDKRINMTTEYLHNRLSQHLPAYMIPSMCLVVQKMPLVPSLKIDRTAVQNWLQGMKVVPGVEMAVILDRLHDEEKTAVFISETIATTKSRPELEGHDFVLHEVGLDSIQSISLLLRIKHFSGMSLPLKILLRLEVTVRELANIIDAKTLTAAADVNVVKEIDDLTPKRIETQQNGNTHSLPESSSRILLTGATGFLGIEILHQIMIQTQCHVCALIRCTSQESGLKRLITIATHQGWWQETYSARINVWPGNLSEPGLGLAPELSATFRQIDHIIHNGAIVNYSMSYLALKPSNVLATTCLLELMARSPSLKSFTFISGGEKPTAEPQIDYLNKRANGYAQSKYVAEALVRKYCQSSSLLGRRVSILKPGYMMGSASKGIANRRDFIWRLVATCIEVGAYNVDEDKHWLFIADVESIAQQVIGCVVDDSEESKSVLCIVHGIQFSDFWDIVQEEVDCHLEAFEASEWLSRIQQRVADAGPSHTLYPLLDTLEHEGTQLGTIYGPAGDVERAKKAVRSNVHYLRRNGLLPAKYC